MEREWRLRGRRALQHVPFHGAHARSPQPIGTGSYQILLRPLRRVASAVI